MSQENVESARAASTARLAVDEVQEVILHRICFAHYKPGTQLKEAELAKEFGVSRTPVREAINRISHLGLVETRNGVGTVVIKLSDDRIRHLYEVRLELASLIGQLSPTRVEEHHRDEARAIHECAVRLHDSFDTREFVRINQRLQNLVYSLIGNEVLKKFWQQAYLEAASVWHRMAQEFGRDVSNALLDETTDLMTALDRGDISAVGFLQRVHIGYGFKLIKKHLLAKNS